LLNSKGWLKVFRDDQLIGQLVMIVLEANTKIVKKFVKSGNKKILQELTQEVLNHEPILDCAYVKEFISKRLKNNK
jgi:flagellar biosynthesis/type III secretory pathway protein FliH